jgi:hypothetical protein
VLLFSFAGHRLRPEVAVDYLAPNIPDQFLRSLDLTDGDDVESTPRAPSSKVAGPSSSGTPVTPKGKGKTRE